MMMLMEMALNLLDAWIHSKEEDVLKMTLLIAFITRFLIKVPQIVQVLTT